jgi:hypothetical protein
MALKIKTGKLTPPVRALIYSNAGFGKTSLASALPKALFIDIEGSSERYNVSRVEAKTEAEVRSVLQELIKDRQGFLTVVIDTADWLESAISDAMCKAQNVKSISECSGGFGKGFVEAGCRFGEILTLCDTLISKGMHVVFLAHSVVKKVSPPDQMESYDRYEIALDAKNFAAPLREWAEMILFGKFDTALVKTKDKKIKADLGEQSRTLYTTNSAAWDAKNRFNLPTEITIQAVEFGADGTIPAEILPTELAAVFAGTAAPVVAPVRVVQPVAAPAAVVAEPAGEPEVNPEPPAPANITAEQRAKLEQYGAIDMCAKVIRGALAHYVCVDVAELTEAQADKVIDRCQEEMNKEPAKPAAPTSLLFPWSAAAREWLTANAPAVNTYLHQKGRITAGQTWKDLHHEKAEKIFAHFEAFKDSVTGGVK